MLKLAGNRGQRDALRDAAQKQAARFSWQDSARQLLQLYEEAVASPKRSGLRQALNTNETIMTYSKKVSDK
jgi:DNA-binding transcriptional regulator YbjK